MAKKSGKIVVIYTPTAQRDLDEIWEYNAEQYGVAHAVDYQQFLQKRTDSLEELFYRGRRVPTRPEYRFLILRRG